MMTAKKYVSIHSQTALALAALFSLSSCSTTGTKKQLEEAVSVSSTWQNAEKVTGALDTQALKSWWDSLQDPVLNQLISDALKQSPDMRSALSKISESRARVGIQTAALLPSVTAKASGSGSRSRNSTTRATNRSESYSVGADTTWEIDLFGKLQMNRKAASEDLGQTEEKFYAAQVALAAEVAQAYVNLRSAEGQLDVVQRSLATRTETYQITSWGEQAGTGSTLDTLQSLTSLEQARATIPSLQKTISQARNQLTLLCGRTPSALDTLLTASGKVPSFSSKLALGIPADTLRQRPDVRAAAHAVEAASLRASATRRERLPSLSLTGSLGLEALKVSNVFDPQTSTAGLLGSLSAPLFTWGKTTQNIRIQDELTKQSLLSYESTVLTALSEVENALIAIRRGEESLATINRATLAAREASQLALLQYKSGQKDILVVLDAQRTELSLEEQLITGSADLTNAHIQLYKALGGGWSHL
jgi:NodT family efflux transporter outer membrane factor (OMF) lipoprotein